MLFGPLPAFPRRPAVAAVAFTGVAALAFLLIQPPVGDLWAARARTYAALHGVGLQYWFGWFGGTVPGHYSVLAPTLMRFGGVALLGSASTVLSVILCRRLLVPAAHSRAAAWLAAVAATFSLWSGRIPFALGTGLLLAAVLAVVGNRRAWAAVAGVATTAVSPVSGAFLVLALGGVVLHDDRRRRAATWAAGGAAVGLLGIGAYFGLPGVEGFPVSHALLVTATCALMLLARPPAEVRTVVVASAVLCPVLALVPNGLGTNFERFAWICLPVAVMATGRARRAVVYSVSAGAVLMGVVGSAHDLYVAAQPMSRPSYTDGLARRLDGTAGLADFRVEVVPDGTHVAAFTLIAHAALARGYETQSDNALDHVLWSPAIDATSYRRWLDDNAVAYVALDRRTLSHNPEDRLVRSGRLPFLREAWRDAHWLLFAVDRPVPVVASPAHVSDADQASLAIAAPRAGSYELRLRWSRFLRLGSDSPPGTLEPGADGGTVLLATAPGSYTLTP